MSETENNELAAGKQSKEPRSNQKLKLLYLAKILLNNTDANHDITLDEILNKLHAYDVTAARKSLYDDIEQLGRWELESVYTDLMKLYLSLDSFGQKDVENLIKFEAQRCKEQNTLQDVSNMAVQITIKK